MENTRNDTLEIIKGATWFGLGTLGGIILEYAINGIAAFQLGPEEFGIFSVGIRVFAISILVSLMALPSSLSYFIPNLQAGNEGEKTGRLLSISYSLSLFSSIVVGGALFFLAPILSKNVFDEPGLTTVLQPFALSLPGAALLAVTAGALRGFKLSRHASMLSSTYERGLRLIFILLFLRLGWGLRGVVLAYIPASLLAFGLGFRILKKTFNFLRKFSIDRSMLTNLTAYAGPVLASQLLTETRNSTHPLVLAYFLDARAVGIFSIATLISGSFGMVLVAFNFLYVPVISGISVTRDLGRIKRIFQMVSTWSFTLLFPIWAPIVLFPEPFLSFFGNQYVEGAWPLRILITGAFLSVALGAVGTTLLATGETRLYLKTNIAGIIVGLALSFSLIPSFGLIGAAAAYSLTILIWNGITLAVIFRRFGIHPLNKSYATVTIVNLAGMVPLIAATKALLPFSNWSILGIVPVYFGLILFIILGFRLMDPENMAVADQTIQEFRKRFAGLISR